MPRIHGIKVQSPWQPRAPPVQGLRGPPKMMTIRGLRRQGEGWEGEVLQAGGAQLTRTVSGSGLLLSPMGDLSTCSICFQQEVFFCVCVSFFI